MKITPKDVKPGDLVKYRGSWYKVKRVNPKSVTIEGWMGIPDWTYLVDYSYISEVKRLKENPRDVIGDPPNSIMRMQLLKLWKEVLGFEDVGDFRTFMKEAVDLTYDEARRKLLKTYGTPERIQMKSVKDVEEAFHGQMCEGAEEQCGKGDAEACRTACEDCGIEEVCAPAEKRPAVTWRNFPDHKSETKAVKEALKKAGIDAEVKHGSETAWGWLEINIGDPRLRNGLRQGHFGSQYTDEERVLHDTVLKIAKDITGRRGDYKGEIRVLSQGWRTKSRPEVKKRIDVPVIPKVSEVVPDKKPQVKQIVESRPKIKRKRQKHSQPDIVMTEFGKTVIKKARGSTIRLTAADMRADAIFIEV